ncbi:MAG: penicillin-binding protein activator LpoB [Deltaproteobacteria bacterium]|nr:penicillin-binding protein activator LpoB [Deltaproteobacteria bacterium]NCP01850.1 penicillin-binding protein activator LpoB [Deltaproteobacteria bacterium]
MNLLKMMVFLLLTFLLAACGTSVKRMEIDEVKDMSGRWNDTDSQMVSEAMVQDCLNHPWLTEFSQRQGKKPDVIVGAIRNRSSEHIATETFTKDLERALINSGRANFVASAEERLGVRDERLDQDLNAAPETRKAPGMEAGADYMLIGAINSIVDKEGGDKVVFYQVDLELIDMTNNRKVWIGNKKIKKFVDRRRFGF